jgi:hypothetical protein
MGRNRVAAQPHRLSTLITEWSGRNILTIDYIISAVACQGAPRLERRQRGRPGR